VTPGAEDATVRAAVLRALVHNYRANGPFLDFSALADATDFPLAQVAAACNELIDANHAYGKGDPAHAVRLNDNGFAFANDALALGMLEHVKVDDDRDVVE